MHGVANGWAAHLALERFSLLRRLSIPRSFARSLFTQTVLFNACLKCRNEYKMYKIVCNLWATRFFALRFALSSLGQQV